MKSITNQKGIALISVLLVLATLMTLTMGFVHYTMQDWLIAKSFHQSNICFYMANAGLEYAKFLIQHNMILYPSIPYIDGIEDNIIDEFNFTIVKQKEVDNAAYMSDNPGDLQPGEIVDLQSGNGQEFLFISRLSMGSDDLVYSVLGKGALCGSFRIRVIEAQDPNAESQNKRVLIVRSEGFAKNIPNSVLEDEPSTWNIETFPVVSRRTLLMRIPYTSLGGEVREEQDDFRILSDSWWERFR